jgi:predicted N-formylglutamate amidohydrolase
MQPGCAIESNAVDTFIISCEHGGHHIPAAWKSLFRGQEAQLASHRGYDAGALATARALAQAFNAPLVAATVSRLLVDLNRSIGHPRHFSPMTGALSADDRNAIIERHYTPYRARLEEAVAAAAARNARVIHVSAHSFTPVLDGRVRNADIGLLYDPARSPETHLCRQWQVALARHAPDLRVRRNYPYRGNGDGMTRHLRQRFGPRRYLGIELELNQALLPAAGRAWRDLQQALAGALRAAVSAN